MQHHREAMGEKVPGDLWFTDFESLEIYGEPNEALTEWLSRVSQGVELAPPGALGGFTRLRADPAA